jgi:hypothetical protein
MAWRSELYWPKGKPGFGQENVRYPWVETKARFYRVILPATI